MLQYFLCVMVRYIKLIAKNGIIMIRNGNDHNFHRTYWKFQNKIVIGIYEYFLAQLRICNPKTFLKLSYQ
jgi:hypothetical protein